MVLFGTMRLQLSLMVTTTSLIEEIKKGQRNSRGMNKLRKNIRKWKVTDFRIDTQGIIRFGDRFCVPWECVEIKQKILEEAHNTPYSVHPGSRKMYKDLRQLYW